MIAYWRTMGILGVILSVLGIVHDTLTGSRLGMFVSAFWLALVIGYGFWLTIKSKGGTK